MSEHSTSSVSTWIDRLKQGDDQAADAICREYFDGLMRAARRKLRQNRLTRVQDEEDVALSALDTFVRRAKAGELEEVTDRGDLWKLLLKIAARRVVRYNRSASAQKRGGGAVAAERDLARQDSTVGGPLDHVAADSPPPELTVMLCDEANHLLGQLAAGDLREIARLTLEGHSTSEIADQLNTTKRTVQRRLALIRAQWQARQADAKGKRET